MLTIVLAGGLVFYATPIETAQRAGLLFVAAQAVLAYFTSGYVKLISPSWRSGDALRGILNTRSYGYQDLAKLLTVHPRLSVAGCWLTIAFECLGPFFVFLGPIPCLVFLVGGVIFHISIAVTMGLNNFVWSFLATYPALLYASTILFHS
jgi:hypothetical protein